MPRIVLTDGTFPTLRHETAVAARHGSVIDLAQCTCEGDVIAAAQGADVLLVQFSRITRRAVDELAPNAAIIRYGIGLDNIDLVAAHERGVRVAYVPDYATGEVADHTVTLILTALRRIVAFDRSIRAGTWDGFRAMGSINSFAGTVVGFIGFGRIGREVHSRLQPFGFRSLVADPFAEVEALVALNARAADLDEIFTSADVLTLHAPLTAATRHLVNAYRLNQMKPGSILVNTARGGLVDTAALEQALLSQRIAGAALDVFEQEPLPADAGIRRCKNVILTPHVAWYSTRALERLQAFAADELDRHLSGRPARCPAPIP